MTLKFWVSGLELQGSQTIPIGRWWWLPSLIHVNAVLQKGCRSAERMVTTPNIKISLLPWGCPDAIWILNPCHMKALETTFLKKKLFSALVKWFIKACQQWDRVSVYLQSHFLWFLVSFICICKVNEEILRSSPDIWIFFQAAASHILWTIYKYFNFCTSNQAFFPFFFFNPKLQGITLNVVEK